MTVEIALLEWGDRSGGIRLLGRSTAPDLVELVRHHLVSELQSERPPRAVGPLLRVVDTGSDAGSEGDEPDAK